MILINKNEFLIFGHRGVPAFAPENTMASFEKAIEFGVNAIELDVILTNDDKVVVFHDYDLNRLADCNRKVRDLSYAELSGFNVSHKWNDEVGFQKIPLLDEVVKIMKQHDMILNIEIKSTGIFPTKIVEKVNDIIMQNKFEDNCIISSFNPLIIRKMKKTNSNLFTSLIWSKNGVSFFQKSYKLLHFISKPNGFHPDINFINPKIVYWAKNKGMPIFVFTINSADDYTKMKELNVDGIFTDNPKIVSSN